MWSWSNEKSQPVFLPGAVKNKKGNGPSVDKKKNTDIMKTKAVIPCPESRSGQRSSRIRIGGGPAKSDEWTQLCATVTGKTIERIANNDTSALGAAVVAAITIGMYQDLKEAVAHMVAIKDVFHPDPAYQEIYDQRYQEYIEKLPVKR